MPLNLLKEQSRPAPINLLAETKAPEAKQTNTVHLEDTNETLSYPADMPNDQLNSFIQRNIYKKPPVNFYDIPLAVGAIVGEGIAQEGIVTAAEEITKAGARGAEGIAGGVGSLVRWYGMVVENSADKDFRFDHINANLVRDFQNKPRSEGFKDFSRAVGGTIAKYGGVVKEFFDKQREEGFAAADPEIFAGSFTDNPSWIRGAAIVSEAIPSLAAATAVTFATKSPTAGAAMLGLLEGSGTFDEAIAADKTVDEATGLGVAAVVGLTILERIPLTRFLRGGGKGKGVAKLTKDIFVGMGQEGSEEVLQALWQNSIAKLGYDKTRQLTEGMVESFIGGAGSGGMMGGITSGRGRQVDRLVKEALEKGVTEAEIEQMRDAVRNGLVHNKDEINALLDKSAKKVKKVNEEKAAEQVAELLAKTEERPTDIFIQGPEGITEIIKKAKFEKGHYVPKTSEVSEMVSESFKNIGKDKDAEFLVGPTASGKTSLAANLQSETETPIIDPDKYKVLYKGYTPEKAFLYHEASSVANRVAINKAVKEGLPFLNVVTGRNTAKFKTIVNDLKKAGRPVNTHYIYVGLSESLRRNEKRRVNKKGMVIPDSAVEANHEGGLKTLFEVFIPDANEVNIFDNPYSTTGLAQALPVAHFKNGKLVDLQNEKTFASMLKEWYAFKGRSLSDGKAKEIIASLQENEGDEPETTRGVLYKATSKEASTETLENRKLSKQTLKKKNTVGKQVIAGIDKVLSPISTRLRQISPKLSAKLTRFEFESRQSVLQDEKAITPYLEGVKAMPVEDQSDLDFAFKNGDINAANAILEKHGLQDAYQAVRTTLNKLYKEASTAGFEVGYIKDFMPRKVRDFEGLREFFQKGHEDIWSDMLRAVDLKEMELGYKLSTQDQAALINSLLRGFGTKQLKLAKPGALKARKVDHITPEINQFYYPTNHSLLNYIYAVNDGIAARRFFGKSFKGAAAGENPNIQDSIGAFVLDALIAREISPLQEQELKNILNARFQPKGPGNIIGGLKNLSYVSTMGNVISAITQIGDLAFSMYNSGILTTSGTLIEALTGNSRVTKEDIGIEKIAQEFEDGGKTRTWLEATFKLTGLTWMDSIGKQTLINSAYKTYQSQVQRDKITPKFRQRLEDIFGDEAGAVIEDLRNDRVTENIKMLLFSELSRFQPITLSEMPETYLTSGNGRVFYMLKTYTIKQIDVFRNEVFLNPNKKEAFGNFVRLAIALVMMNATADVIKDFILGRPFEPEDTLIDNILRLIGFSKFQVYTARQEGLGRAFLKGILIPPLEPINILDNMYMDIKRAVKEGEISLNELDTIQRIPFVGKLYYWWFGRGRSKTEKKIGKKQKFKR